MTLETPYGSEEQMTLDTLTKAGDKAQIRGLLDDWAEAARSGDIDAIMTAYAPDILAFDAIAQLQFKGADAYRTHWQACIEMCSGPMIFEIHDLSVTAGEGVAFGHYLLRCGRIGEDGEEQAGWMRATVCWRKRSGRWTVVHEHFSAPFDPASGKALLDLKP
jgi:ketosteroid isomerase-like protein